MSASPERDTMIATLREEALKDTEKYAEKQRFGLFSQPPTLAVGDNSYFQPKKAKRDQNGKVVTEPRGVYTIGAKTGTAKMQFTPLEYTTIGDPYIDPARRARIEEKQNKKRGISHDGEFKPANPSKMLTKGLFPHEPDFEVKKKVRQLDPNGRVLIGPKNITTNPPKAGHYGSTVGHLLDEAQMEWQKDEYERARELRFKELQENKKKMKPDPFRSMDPGSKNFNKDKNVFGSDVPPPTKKEKKVEERKDDRDPFKPSNPSKKVALGRCGII
eukprot:TRINITY_DN14110_c0_g1_i3.p1 TRINITY_DN14110_c0_g1~~TRINITY_DN14110_c0_g1_i3.p1  ORF type:complete len:273 (-),score=73.80 TRINITY_DN14110_c0_g1_i3:333-1151(-)